MNAQFILIGVLAAGLLLAVCTDMLYNRIPNWLVLLMSVSAISGHTFMYGFSGLLFSISGLVVGLACFLPLYIFSRMGAGDVKLLAAVGAVLGPSVTITAAVITVIAGGIIALIFIPNVS